MTKHFKKRIDCTDEGQMKELSFIYSALFTKSLLSDALQTHRAVRTTCLCHMRKTVTLEFKIASKTCVLFARDQFYSLMSSGPSHTLKTR